MGKNTVVGTLIINGKLQEFAMQQGNSACLINSEVKAFRDQIQ